MASTNSQMVKVPMRFSRDSGATYTEADIYVSVDFDAIAADLGRKALHNKKHISKYLSGAVVVEATNIRKEQKV